MGPVRGGWVHMCNGWVRGGARWWVASYLDLRRGQPTDREMMSFAAVGGRSVDPDPTGWVGAHVQRVGVWWCMVVIASGVCAERISLVGKRRPATAGF